MKKIQLLIIAVACSLFSQAQVSKADQQLALGFIEKHASQIGLSVSDLKNIGISSTYQTADGIRMVYAQQTFEGLPLHNQMLVLAFRNGQLLSSSGVILPQVDQRIEGSERKATVSAFEAVKTAILDVKIQMPALMPPFTDDKGRQNFGRPGKYFTDITAHLIWVPVNDKQVRLAWEIELAPEQSSDHWMIRVDANTNQVINKNNYTVYEHFGNPHGSNCQDGHKHNDQAQTKLNAGADRLVQPEGPLAVNSATYRVIPYPAESPIHPGGTAALVTDPWNLASGNATSLQWHYDGSVYHDSTRGNNVWAIEDRDASNATFGKAGLSTTAQPNLTLDYAPNYSQAPTTATNQQFAITNLFYWNNLVHDIAYLYGFDEPSGNFQNNNQGRGGAGGDYVIADAQDAAGTNNANFSTPSDGVRPRMQMFLWTGVTPNIDGDLDNGIIAHEYGHGISNRLTGGPSNVSCLGNAEQAGEGWSDYIALMTTTNWATAQVTDGSIPRGIGTYALNQPTSGAGIRRYRYTTNMSINPWTYGMMAGSTGGAVHTIGEMWCTFLWDMTWEMIAVDGINPNLFNPSATGGNSAALKLVMEGMRLQPCSPGFVDSRNAILKADSIFYNGRYKCAIWKAFSRRGMGLLASQGSSSSYTDQVESFVNPGAVSISLTQSVTAQQEGLQVTYTNRVSVADCQPVNNFLLTDTLPANVTYVSGGSYNSSNRVVSFPVNLAAGQTQDYSFTVSINPGSYFAPDTLINEKLTGPAGAIPAGWSASSTTSSVWTTHSTRSYSAPNSFFTPNRTTTSGQTLSTTNSIAIGTNVPEFSFRHWYNSEAGWDGGVIEVSTNGGSSWADLGNAITANGYNGSLGTSMNPLTGRAAFTGNSGSFILTKLDLAAYQNQNILIRFRFGSDESLAVTGWNIDDILMTRLAQVKIKSNLFNASMILQSQVDTFTLILPGACIGVTPVSINTQPVAEQVCEGASAEFSVTVTGTDPVYQWQVSDDGGSSFENINGANANTYSFIASAAQNGLRYRCVISNECNPEGVISNDVLLTVHTLPLAPSPSGGIGSCGPGSIILTAIPGSNETIDWYAAASGGSALISGSASYTTPVLTNSTTYYAEARNQITGCVSASRTAIIATVNSIPAAPSAEGASRCGAGSVNISATPGPGQVIDWYVVPTGGISVASGNVYATGTLSSNTIYYAAARNTQTGCVSSTRTPVTVTILAVTGSTTPVSICNSDLPYNWNGQQYTTGGTYTVTLTNAAGCDSIATLLLDIAPAIQLFNVTGGGSYTTGGQGVPVGLSGSQIGMSYQLYVNSISTGSPVSGTGNAISFGNQTAAGAYTVTASSGICSANMLNSVNVTVTTSVTPAVFAVTGGGTYCQGGNGITVGLAGSETGVQYQLRRSNGSINVGAPVNGTGTAISFGLQTSSGDYSVLATHIGSGISQPMANYVLVRIAQLRKPNAPGAVTGPTDVCNFMGGAPVQYRINQVSSATSYLWTAPAGASIIGSNTDTVVTISYPSNFVSGTLSVVAVNACFNNSVSNARNVTIRRYAPGTPGAITASVANPCAIIGTSQTAIYTIRPVTYASAYSWTLSSGITLVSQYGDTGVIVRFEPGFSSGTISVRASNACSISNARTINITAQKPTTPVAITGPSAVCELVGQPTTATYSISPVSGAGSYLWSVPVNASIVSGQGSTSISVSYLPGFSSGSVSVVASAPCGNSSARSLSVSATRPTTPVSITGPTQVCSFVGQPITATYSINPVAGASSYLWTVPANVVIVTGQGTNTVTLSYSSGFRYGNISVASVANCGSSSARSLSVTTLVTKPGAITASGPACPGATVTFSIDPVSNATTYLWYLPSNAIYVSGQGTTSYTVTFKPEFTSGQVSVKSRNECSSSAAVALALSAAECTPPSFSGQPGKRESEGFDVVSVFPNPSAGIFQAKLKTRSQSGILQWQIVDMYGKPVWQKRGMINQGGLTIERIDASALPSGVYELRCLADAQWKSVKLVIAR